MRCACLRSEPAKAQPQAAGDAALSVGACIAVSYVLHNKLECMMRSEPLTDAASAPSGRHEFRALFAEAGTLA